MDRYFKKNCSLQYTLFLVPKTNQKYLKLTGSSHKVTMAELTDSTVTSFICNF